MSDQRVPEDLRVLYRYAQDHRNQQANTGACVEQLIERIAQQAQELRTLREALEEKEHLLYDSQEDLNGFIRLAKRAAEERDTAKREIERLKRPMKDAMYAVVYAASSWLDRTSNSDHRWVSLQGRLKIWMADAETSLKEGFVRGWGTDGFPWNRSQEEQP